MESVPMDVHAQVTQVPVFLVGNAVFLLQRFPLLELLVVSLKLLQLTLNQFAGPIPSVITPILVQIISHPTVDAPQVVVESLDIILLCLGFVLAPPIAHKLPTFGLFQPLTHNPIHTNVMFMAQLNVLTEVPVIL
jgi:hypothetical protein